MRWRFTGGMVEAVFEDGMDITNEPGIYIQGSHGIRIENVMVAKNDVKNGVWSVHAFRDPDMG